MCAGRSTTPKTRTHVLQQKPPAELLSDEHWRLSHVHVASSAVEFPKSSKTRPPFTDNLKTVRPYIFKHLHQVPAVKRGENQISIC